MLFHLDTYKVVKDLSSSLSRSKITPGNRNVGYLKRMLEYLGQLEVEYSGMTSTK